ncbi:MAG TPA: nitronate monooxygenase family protein [Armatimonadota bacterium]|jgi:NAD(P)H-dependent flavin oxidoreductase YrpB (nitropropane dioxygenase family)
MANRESLLPPLQIGDRVARVPIIQGGMGVGVSLSGLASAVARAGGIGVIAGAGLGLVVSPKGERFAENNLIVLRDEVQKAREMAPGGLIGVNLMVALTDYAEMCRTASEAGVDFIFSGAGLPLALPHFVENPSVKLVPIVSSGRAAGLISSAWKKKYSRIPDAFVVEGPKAGGHLGFSRLQLQTMELYPIEQLLTDTLEAVRPYEEAAGRPIPVVAGGGVFDGADIARMIRLGASGVQMATRFVCTDECDADPAFKQAFLSAKPEDVIFVNSPVGMPGRAIRNVFLNRLEQGEKVHTTACPYHCLKTCDPETKPYCIAIALNQARLGNLDQGLIFAGANVTKVTSIVPVAELMQELVTEAEEALRDQGAEGIQGTEGAQETEGTEGKSFSTQAVG